MSGSNLGKNNWALFLMILAGIVIGGFIGWLTKDVAFLSWLNFGQSFGLTIKITIGGIIGVIIGVVIYKLL